MRKISATTTRRTAAGRAIRIVMPEDLEVKVEAEARRRGLALGAAVRTLLMERVSELDDFARMSRAEEWQRAEAWSTWESIQNGTAQEVSKAEIDASMNAAISRTHAAKR
ncbi:MAG TPA: hypothetical protein PK156_21660 [Polyangium sp.]|nr:hypothetical protein [Polyangium sp.]